MVSQCPYIVIIQGTLYQTICNRASHAVEPSSDSTCLFLFRVTNMCPLLLLGFEATLFEGVPSIEVLTVYIRCCYRWYNYPSLPPTLTTQPTDNE